MEKKVLLITPPFTQLNTPYPATMYLKGYLNTKGVSSFQMDLGIEVILELFSSSTLPLLFEKAELIKDSLSENSTRILHLKSDYIRTIDAVIGFLQHKNPTLAHVICAGSFLPEASRFAQLEDLEWAFGTMGTQDKARHLATLYLEDISDFIIEAIDPHFGFSRYAERLAISAATFDELETALSAPESIVDSLMLGILDERIKQTNPSLVALSVPFPGNLYAALRCGKWIKQHHSSISIAMGGGYPNTELRSLSDPRVFDYLDFITLDDGETPIMHLLEFLDVKRSIENLKRTFARIEGTVTYYNASNTPDVAQFKVGTPDYSDLKLNDYLSVIEVANPMHRMWSDGRWNKLTLAHGCYWGKCTFCDISLDYIQRYEPSSAKLICDRIETIIAQTGETGFHFVDEAAPPSLMKELALELLHRGITIVWWTNIRFEKSFTRDLCILLRESGCIAVSGGLEVASDRLLQLIDKGVTVNQVAVVADNFTNAGIMTHAYLMYGFPTQTAQETIDSLEIVRQMFEAGIIQSGFWHQFAMTAHSPVGIDPKSFQTEVENNTPGTFANNEIAFVDATGTNHPRFSKGLRTSLFNFMHGVGFEIPISDWFNFRVPKTKIAPNQIEAAITNSPTLELKPSSKLVWIGGKVEIRKTSNPKSSMVTLVAINKQQDISVSLETSLAEWLLATLNKISAQQGKASTISLIQSDFMEKTGLSFEPFFLSNEVASLRQNGLLLI